jgi:peptide/nickel transport system substrate-binding protein
MDRRKYLKYVAGVVVAGAAAAVGYGLYQSTPPPAPPPTTTSTAMATTVAPVTTTTAPAEQLLVIAMDQEVLNIDPANASSYNWASDSARSILYDQLTEYQKVPDPNYPGFTAYVPFVDAPMLATSWEWAPDSKSVVYQLRKGVKFTDGTEMTANDVKYSLERFPKTSTISWIAGQVFFDHCEVIDDYTVKIVFKQPSPMAKKALALAEMGSVYNAKVAQAHATSDDPEAEKWLDKNDVGAAAGPFMIDHWTPGVEIVYKANPNYWKGKPAMDKVLVRYVPNVSDRTMMVQEGAVDVIWPTPGKDLKVLEGSPDVTVYTHVSPTFTYGNINHHLEPWQDKGLRQALSYAIPYDTIINQVLYGYASQMKSPVTEGVDTHTDEFWNYKYDLDTARKLLDQTKYAGGVTIDAVYEEGNDQERDVMTWIQSEWAKLKVQMNLKPSPAAALADARVKGTAPFHLWTSNPFVKDPFYQLYYWYHSHAIGSWPLCIFNNNPQVDSLIDNNIAEIDDTKRTQASHELQRIILDDATLFFMYQPKFALVARKNIKGLGYWCDEAWGRSLQYVTKG